MTEPPRLASEIDLEAIQTQAEFAAAFEALHEQSGLSYEAVAKRVSDTARIDKISVSRSRLNDYARGRHLPYATDDFEAFRKVLRVGYGIDDPPVVDAWIAAVLRAKGAPRQRGGNETAPYPGLRPFHQDELKWFFGQDEALKRLREVVGACIADRSHSMLVEGPSGSGKSSLVNVAVPALAAELAGPGPWQVRYMTPGSDPIAELETTLDAGGQERCLLVVDQLEEIWTEADDPLAAAEFLDRLQAATTDSESPLVAILVVSADFHPKVLAHGFLSGIGLRRRVELTPMKPDQFRAVIAEPARAVNVTVEPALVSLLLNDILKTDRNTVSALPLLALALHDLWSRGSRRAMTAADYTEVGGLNHIVERTADEAIKDLDDTGLTAARELLTRMVSVQDGFPPTRHWLATDDIDALRARHASTDAVLDRLTESRILVRDREEVSLAHDAVLHAWPRLRDWIERDRRRLAARSELERLVERWDQSDRARARLLAPRALIDALEGALGPHPDLSMRQREFLDASRLKAKRARRGKLAVTALVTGLVLGLAASLLTVVDQNAAAERTALAAEAERIQAESRMIAARAERLREADPALAAQLAVAAYRTHPTADARSALLSATGIPPVTRLPSPAADSVLRLAVNPEGDLAAATVDSTTDGTVLLWNIAEPFDPELVATSLPGVDGAILTAAFASDGRLYSASRSGEVHVHEVSATAAPLPVLSAAGSPSGFNSVAVHEQTGTVAAAGPDTRIWLWSDLDLAGDPVLLEGTGGDIRNVAFSPDGSRLAAAASNGEVALHDLADAAESTPPTLLDAGYDRYLDVAFSPDGTLLAAGTSAGPVALWDLDGEPSPPRILEGPTAGWATAVAFLPGSPFLLASSQDGLWMWNLDTGAKPSHLPSSGNGQYLTVNPLDGAVFAGYGDGRVERWQLPGTLLNAATSPIRNIDFLPDASTFAAAGNRSIWMWEVADHGGSPTLLRQLESPDPDDGLIGNLSVNHDGTLLASAGRTGTIWVWELENLDAAPIALSGFDTMPYQVVFSPVDDRLAAAGEDGSVALWDLGESTDAALVQEISDQWTGALAFAPDGEVLVTGGFDASLRVWDATDSNGLVELVAPLEAPTQPIEHLEFSHDGGRIAAASHDGNVYLWDASDLDAAPIVLRGNNVWMATVAFSPDDTLLAGASADGSAVLWDLEDPENPERHAMVTGVTPPLTTVEFSIDGTMLAGAGGDAVARWWLTDPEEAAAAICAAAGAGVSEDEWRVHLPSLRYRPPC